MNSREAAYLALLTSLRQEGFVSHFLEQWQNNENPSDLDFAFAQEIAFGTTRLALALDHISAQLSTHQKLSLKLKERALLRTAIYQHFYMSKVPLYAIVNETIELAKKYCHRTFANYLNAILRKLSSKKPALPTGNTPVELSIRFSYPLPFIGKLIAAFGKEKTEDILNGGNKPAKTMARLRPGINIQDQLPLKLISDTFAIIDKASMLNEIASSPFYYIQNITPAFLVAELAKLTKPPNRILDLCASPGGKLIAAYDKFPEAELFGNDVSQDKIFRLSQNFTKYKIPINLSCELGEKFSSPHSFDLIILDVPCSNSGVLNKRPEARWRLTQEAINELTKKQMRLIEKAATLLSNDGAIWYLTCSILSEENENLINTACTALKLKISFSKTILPNEEGWDGGFACLLHQAF